MQWYRDGKTHRSECGRFTVVRVPASCRPKKTPPWLLVDRMLSESRHRTLMDAKKEAKTRRT